MPSPALAPLWLPLLPHAADFRRLGEMMTNDDGVAEGQTIELGAEEWRLMRAACLLVACEMKAMVSGGAENDTEGAD